jgi:hypothetical protein
MVPDKETTLRWKIDKDLELYRFYLDMSVKAAVFLMTVTGATASYVLSNARSHVSGVALTFPALMNAGFAVLFFYSIREAKRLFCLHKEACRELGVPAFNMNPLRAVCEIFCLMCGAAAVGLLLLMAYSWLSLSSMSK